MAHVTIDTEIERLEARLVECENDISYAQAQGDQTLLSLCRNRHVQLIGTLDLLRQRRSEMKSRSGND